VSLDEDADPGLAGDRTQLAWSRSALNLSANGLLIARAALEANLVAFAISATAVTAAAALLIWHRAELLTPGRRRPLPGPHHQQLALFSLAALTVVTAAGACAIAVW
jgi:uncharacterized membrane protein YidH (DUF202 family)